MSTGWDIDINMVTIVEEVDARPVLTSETTAAQELEKLAVGKVEPVEHLEKVNLNPEDLVKVL